MKFRFCGGLEPPDWLLAELPLLVEKNSNATPSDLAAMSEAIGADITVQELELTQAKFREGAGAKAVVAALRFILIHAAKYNAERAELVEELQQLGMEQAAAEAVAQSYEDQRVHIQSQQRAQRFEFPHIEKLEWKVESPAIVKLNLQLSQPVMECSLLPMIPVDGNKLGIEVGEDKFLALYEELSQAQTLLQGAAGL